MDSSLPLPPAKKRSYRKKQLPSPNGKLSPSKTTVPLWDDTCLERKDPNATFTDKPQETSPVNKNISPEIDDEAISNASSDSTCPNIINHIKHGVQSRQDSTKQKTEVKDVLTILDSQSDNEDITPLQSDIAPLKSNVPPATTNLLSATLSLFKTVQKHSSASTSTPNSHRNVFAQKSNRSLFLPPAPNKCPPAKKPDDILSLIDATTSPSLSRNDFTIEISSEPVMKLKKPTERQVCATSLTYIHPCIYALTSVYVCRSKMLLLESQVN